MIEPTYVAEFRIQRAAVVESFGQEVFTARSGYRVVCRGARLRYRTGSAEYYRVLWNMYGSRLDTHVLQPFTDCVEDYLEKMLAELATKFASESPAFGRNNFLRLSAWAGEWRCMTEQQSKELWKEVSSAWAPALQYVSRDRRMFRDTATYCSPAEFEVMGQLIDLSWHIFGPEGLYITKPLQNEHNPCAF